MQLDKTYPKSLVLSVGIINFFVFIALLRLTNFNYYLSSFLGLETEINSTGGNAFNFINYIGAVALVIISVAKLGKDALRWHSAWPIYVLMAIYMINAVLAPYSNYTWLLYQQIFLVIALILHLYVQKLDRQFSVRFKNGINLFFWLCMFLVVFCIYVIFSQNSLGYFLEEFNEVFVHSLDDFGIMKQQFGYLLGFLLSYALFFISSRPIKILCIAIILSIGLGIRSFSIGITGALIIYSIARPKLLFPTMLIMAIGCWVVYNHFLESLIFDTRFYPFLNAFDIVSQHPFGVGLGGYPVYTESFSRELFAAFYNVNAILDYVPTAPESDLVHLFGSLGLTMGLIHIGIILRMIWYSLRYQLQFNTFEKCIIFYFCFMTFFGISEDSMFSINYWVFFGLASGIIAIQLKKARANDATA